MRTTLTIEDDVAAALNRMRTVRSESLKELVNEALRRGLKDMSSKPKQREPFRTQSVVLGAVRISEVDDIGDALAISEGEGFK